MNIEKIKNLVEDNKNKIVNFKFNGSRNQVEEFSGKIEKTYKCVFTIKIENNITKSFSYADILTGNLEMKIM